jgi:alpha-1,2-mannosyltransferase
VLTAVSVGAVFLTVWLSTGMMGYRGTAGRLGVTGVATGLAVWLEPFTSGLDLGQINAVLMLFVVADLALPDRYRLKGAGVGLATACKLVPGIFVVYLLLTRRVRAAAVAAGAFVVTSLAGWLAAPRASAGYWLHGLFLDPSRVTAATGPAFVANQSLRGTVARSGGESGGATALWLVAALVVGVSGLAVAVLAHRRGEEAVAVTTVAFTAVLVCPVSWSHHWVWVVVLMPVLLDVVLRLGGRAQVLAAGLLPVWTAVLLVWPLRGRPGEVVSMGGLIWVAERHGAVVRWLGQNLYVLAALGMLALTAGWLARAPRRSPLAR